jgi:8-oxo-dGTP diphosphatase
MTELAATTQAVVPILRKDGRVLVIRRGPDVILPGYWCPPSGRVEPGETQEQAVRRELAEELGLDRETRGQSMGVPD